MLNPLKLFKQHRRRVHLSKERTARQNFLNELRKPHSTKLRNTRPPFR